MSDFGRLKKELKIRLVCSSKCTARPGTTAKSREAAEKHKENSSALS